MSRTYNPAPDNRVPYRFATQVPGAGSGSLEMRVPRDGTIESVRVRIYIGAQLDLHLVPVIERAGQSEDPLINFVDVAGGGKAYLDGDDDDFPFTVSIPVRKDEKIKVYYENLDPVNAYDFAVDIEIDFFGGANRPYLAAKGGM